MNIKSSRDPYFCKGSTENFILEADIKGGKSPYFYEWSGVGIADTLQSIVIISSPKTNGIVKLKITDSSKPSKEKQATFQINEIEVKSDFTFTPDSNCAQETMSFQAIASDGIPDYKYLWRFKDGKTSNKAAPVHEFISSGCSGYSTFNVQLSVWDNYNCFSTITKTVTVKDKPYLSFSDGANTTDFKHCHLPDDDPTFDVQLVNNSVNTECISKYRVDWGDSTIVDSATFPLSHTYNVAGAFEIEIIAENTSGCNLVWKQYVYNQSIPGGGVTGVEGSMGCAPIHIPFVLNGWGKNSIGTSYIWDFGDGTPTVEWGYGQPYINDTIKHEYFSPSCEYDAFSGFTTTVTINNGCGSRISTVDGTSVWTKPSAEISYENQEIATLCIGEQIQFGNSSGTGYFGPSCDSSNNTLWDFDDSTSFSPLSVPPPVSWSIPGEYDVLLNVGNPCGVSEDTFTVIVTGPVDADFSADTTKGCALFSPVLTNNSVGEYMTYKWECYPSDGFSFIGGTDEKSEIPEVQFNKSGNFRLVLYVFNVCGVDSFGIDFSVYEKPQGVLTDIENICSSLPEISPKAIINNNGASVTSYNWSFINGLSTTANTLVPGTVNYPGAGSYPVSLSLTNICGTSLIMDTFSVIQAPLINIPDKDSICESESFVITGSNAANIASFIWETSGDGLFSNDSLFNPIYKPGSQDITNNQVTLKLKAQGNSPCGVDSSLLNLKIYPKPVALLGSNAVVCKGAPFKIKDAMAQNYDSLFWTTSGDGLFSDSHILLPTYIPGINDLSSGAVTLTLTARGLTPCMMDSSDSFVINYASQPKIDAGGDADICKNSFVNLNATGKDYASLKWSFQGLNPGTFSNANILQPTFTMNSAYTQDSVVLVLEASGGFGCPAVTDSLTLNVIQNPIVNAGTNGVVCENGVYNVTGATNANSASFYWSTDGDGNFDDSTLIEPKYTPGSADISKGIAKLQLNVIGISVCATISDSRDLIIQGLPISIAGADEEICKVFDFTTKGSHINGGSYTWITKGTGSFSDSTVLQTKYSPSVADKALGKTKLILKIDPIVPCAIVDYDTLELIYIDPPLVNAGNDSVICAADFTPLSAKIKNSTQFTWSSSGSGSWLNESTIFPTYSPSQDDITKGSVILTLSSTNAACPLVDDDLELSLIPHPISFAGKDAVICEDLGFTIADAKAQFNSSFKWNTTGSGSFNDSSVIQPIYMPDANDVAAGYVKLYLTSAGNTPCLISDVDTMLLTIQKNPLVYAGNDQIVGEDEGFVTNEATTSFSTSIVWSTNGDGSFLDKNKLITTYQPGPGDLLNKNVDLIVKARSISPCIKEVVDTLNLLITPKPKADAGDNIKICEGSGVTIFNAKAEEYSEIFWVSRGTGVLKNDSSLSPSYQPSLADITDRKVMLVFHARGKDPITHIVAKDSMEIEIIHNAQVNVIEKDTACENFAYHIKDVVYKDLASVLWKSEGNGTFNADDLEKPEYSFSGDDGNKDNLLFYVEANSIAPCVHIDRDTLEVRIYHEPEPLFDYTPKEGCSPLEIGFVNNSNGEELTYSWVFGSLSGSNDQTPSNVIFDQGRIADTTYVVSLTAKNRCNTITVDHDVLVKPIPITNFGMDVAWGCSPKEINFFNVTTGLADKYLWKWGDNESNSNKAQPGSHIFRTETNDTIYTITLVAENECGVDSMQKKVTIFPNKVNAFFETDTNLGCVPMEVNFLNFSRGVLGDEPFLNWSWYFGDGDVTTELNPTHVFNKPGTYRVVLYVNDTCSFDTAYTDITVFAQPHVDFISDKTEYCGYDTVVLIPQNMPVNKLAGLEWDFGDSISGNSYIEKHLYANEGVFHVNLKATDVINGCTAEFSKNITVNKVPEASFIIPDNDACEPLDITFENTSASSDYYAWSFGNGNKSIAVNGHQLYSEPGSFIIALSALNKFGCQDSFKLPLVVNPKPTASFNASSEITCFPPVDVQFTNQSLGADDYFWDFANGVISKETNPSTSFENYGDYEMKLIATNKFFCRDTSLLTYHVYHNPIAKFTVDTAIGCDPFTVQFYDKSEYGSSLIWDFENGNISDEKEPAYTYDEPGISTVILKVTGDGGCSDSISKSDFILTHPSPESEFTYTLINDVDTIQFHNYSNGGETYFWNFGDNQSSDEEQPWHRYHNYGSYNVALTSTNEFGCENTYHDSINFKLFKGLHFPNAFSPNNLSENVRQFKIVGMGLVKYHLLVYDTWGNLLWETTKLERGAPAEAWDGTYKGRPLEPDVYVWHLKEAVFKDGSNYNGEKYGSITILK